MLGNSGYSKSLQVPKAYHGKVIGRQQATKKDIESDYGVVITMPNRDNAQDETITIQGSTQVSVDAAENRILDICGMGKQDAGRAKLNQLDSEMDQAFAHAKSLSNGPERTAAYAKANQLKAQYDQERASQAKKVFEAKNLGYGDDQMDLHGLSVKDAEEAVNQRLDKVKAKLERNDGQFVLSIITGFGHHSDNNVAKIKPAIMDLLTERGFRYQLDDSQGTLLVDGTTSGKASTPAPARAAPTSHKSNAPKEDESSDVFTLLLQLFSCCLGALRKR